MKSLQKTIRALFENEVALHVFFCLFFISLFSIPVIISDNPRAIAVNGMVVCIFLLICIYIGRWCARKWLIHKKFYTFLINTTLCIVILAVISSIGSGFLFKGDITGFWLQYLGISIPTVILFVAFGIFVSVSRATLIQQINEAKTAQQVKERELELLLSQLSPHFLFNTLNNLYGLSILQPRKIPDLLLKLSDILRYSIYDTKQAFVPLADELAYIQNYIQLEKIRIGDRLSLSTDFVGVENATSRIAPMLLITFIENAFKHSKNTFDQNIKIKISLHIVDGTILFNIENTCGDDKNEKDKIDKRSGLGLPNTIKRLKLLYPGEHELDCYKQNNYYYVKLKLKTK